MGQGDISKEEYDDIVKLCIICFRGGTRTKPGTCNPLSRSNRIAWGGVTWAETCKLLKEFKTDILSTVTTELDVL